MHPAARRCVWGTVVLWVTGAALVGFAPTLYDLADGWPGEAVDIAVGFLQQALVPTGAVLVGAAVVIQALRGTRPSSGAGAASGSQEPPVAEMVPTAEPQSSTALPPLPAPPWSGAVPSVPLSGAVPSVPLSGAVPSVPLSSPVPAVPPVSDLVPAPGGAPSPGPVLPGSGAAPVVGEKPSRGGRPRSRRRRG